jgi:hypothetical protein
MTHITATRRGHRLKQAPSPVASTALAAAVPPIDPVLERTLTGPERNTLLDLHACAAALNASIREGQSAQMRIEAGLTTAARRTVQACRSLSPAELATLVRQARMMGLIYKRSTPATYALMRIACGRMLKPSTVSRAATLCQRIIDIEADLDEVLPSNAPFWRVFEKQCGKRVIENAAVHDRVPLVLESDIKLQLQYAARLRLDVSWDAERKVAVGQLCGQEGDASAKQTLVELNGRSVPREVPMRLITFQPSNLDAVPVVIGPEDHRNLHQAGSEGEEQTGEENVCQAVPEHPGTPDVMQCPEAQAATITPAQRARELALPRHFHQIRRSDLRVSNCEQLLQDGSAGAEMPAAVYILFSQHVKQTSPEDFKVLSVGRWLAIKVGGESKKAWHGEMSPAIQEVMERQRGRFVTPDPGAPA